MDKMHGFGVYRFANRHRYEGAWHEGRRQGLGMYTFRSGETQSGHWNNRILDVPSTQNTSYPVSPVAVYHSKVLNAVQVNLPCQFEIGLPLSSTVNLVKNLVKFIVLWSWTYLSQTILQDRSETCSWKAYDVVKVDERVNRAVAAANRAANAARVVAVKALQKQMH
ncbi:histone H3 K4-specific methyltransferase SET7/9 family protein [Actinidia rufa]|uniref:Histone H3 K4-specific methyltransferase SET7/9 family protein n=1 Tax=Actinidia rufa TaxID=165716 RepID=A0A7J0FPZ9_9ERIC|nr:histone H3 K4-specific methyltransferase SET7/9 family protein [Actinidia rufa]